MFNIKKISQNQNKTIDLRQRLLQKEFEGLTNIPNGCNVLFDNPDILSTFKVIITPDKDSYWYGGSFEFLVQVPESYNFEVLSFKPPKVHCNTKIWHPNINEKGDVCLSILRQNSIDAYGWLPTRTIIEVIFGVNSLFYDLVNFDDPLNIEAANMYQSNKETFIRKVKEYITRYCGKVK